MSSDLDINNFSSTLSARVINSYLIFVVKFDISAESEIVKVAVYLFSLDLPEMDLKVLSGYVLSAWRMYQSSKKTAQFRLVINHYLYDSNQRVPPAYVLLQS